MLKKKIGWQKYENVIEEQINSPVIDMLASSVKKHRELEPRPNIGGYQEIEEAEEFQIHEESPESSLIFSVSDGLSNEISLVANFDCWLGHINFNLTDEIKDIISKQDGVEVLKVCSRYRFFIGVGRMFDFKDVRNGIECALLGKDKDEQRDY